MPFTSSKARERHDGRQFQTRATSPTLSQDQCRGFRGAALHPLLPAVEVEVGVEVEVEVEVEIVLERAHRPLTPAAG